MQYFVYIFIATIIVVAVSSALLRKKNPRLTWVPGVVLSVVSFVVAIISYFTLNGWDSMGFFFMFISVLIGSLLGTVVAKFQKSASH
ncbi:YesK family protein [Bacillus sp. CGMCC 1.60114]|uniref:YesK family protein n=1 Tax=unclassified Bacillus (in: firmicutes) TaxID=185979 RepID=UPI00362C80B8